MYDRVMRTLVILGDLPLPAGLREIIERGSTSVVEKAAAELAGRRANEDVDRVVIWGNQTAGELTRLAHEYSRGASPEQRNSLIVIAPDSSVRTADVSPVNEVFVWPRDEDRLKVAFMTGG